MQYKKVYLAMLVRGGMIAASLGSQPPSAPNFAQLSVILVPVASLVFPQTCVAYPNPGYLPTIKKNKPFGSQQDLLAINRTGLSSLLMGKRFSQDVLQSAITVISKRIIEDSATPDDKEKLGILYNLRGK